MHHTRHRENEGIFGLNAQTHGFEAPRIISDDLNHIVSPFFMDNILKKTSNIVCIFYVCTCVKRFEKHRSSTRCNHDVDKRPLLPVPSFSKNPEKVEVKHSHALRNIVLNLLYVGGTYPANLLFANLYTNWRKYEFLAVENGSAKA